MIKLTTENMNKLLKSQGQGRRCVKIEIEPEDMSYGDRIKIRCWDYDQLSGETIKEISDLPTKETMIQKKRERLEAELKELDETK